MSELADERRQLYVEMELEELYEETPVDVTYDKAKAQEVGFATTSFWHLSQYFERKSAEDPAFNGYAACAEKLENAMRSLTEIDTEADGESEAVYEIDLFLKPRINSADRDISLMSYDEAILFKKQTAREKLYQDENHEAVQALMLLAYKTAGAETLVTDLDEQGRGDVLIHGKIGSKHIYFVEHYAKDETGDFMSWTAMNEVPERLMPKPKPRETELKPFVTTSEEDGMRSSVIDIIAERGVVDVDEAKLVEEYFGNKKAA